MEKKRLNWIDMAKGFAMILVMFGHAPILLPIQAEVYTFHVPLFFFMSGYLFSNIKYNNFSAFLKKRIITIGIPYFCFSFIEYIYFFVFNNKQNVSPLKSFIGTLIPLRYNNGTLHNGTLWFIACLFMCEMIFFLIVKWTKNDKRKIITCLVVSAIIGGIYNTYIGKPLPWSFDVAFIAVVFYGIGYLIKGMENKVSKLVSIKYLVVFLIINVIIGHLNVLYMNARVDMSSIKYGNYFLFFGSAISGIMASLIFCRLLPKSKLLIYIGKNSIIFFAFHQMILYPIIDKLITHISFLTSEKSYIVTLNGIIHVGVTLIVMVPIIYVINNYMPFILGKRFSKRGTKSEDTSITNKI
ncbi:acyltransferase family protein [Clostridium estertheticum]|uniref:acyltransferase family protein n=1 Tax=Clostridium estertheticum TaxID=238834 RepID=UPI001CF52AF4|nr:acyltransferase family protein [Clostridium estertheticum]MCB2357842.1 acyltransferase family protein [Clostridium estertheticum]